MAKFYFKGLITCNECNYPLLAEEDHLCCENTVCKKYGVKYAFPIIELTEYSSHPKRPAVNPEYSTLSCLAKLDADKIECICCLANNHKGNHIAIFEEGFIEWSEFSGYQRISWIGVSNE